MTATDKPMNNKDVDKTPATEAVIQKNNEDYLYKINRAFKQLEEGRGQLHDCIEVIENPED